MNRVRISILCVYIFLLIFPNVMYPRSAADTDFSVLKNNATVSDSIPALQRNKIGLLEINNIWTPIDDNITFNDTMFYSPSFLPIVFDGRILPYNMDFIKKDSSFSPPVFHLISPDSTLQPYINESKKVHEMRKMYFLNPENRERIHYSTLMLKKVKPVSNEGIDANKNIFQNLITAEDPIQIATPPELQKYVPKKKRWFINGEHSLQIAQNHISDNWYKGGNSSFYIKNYHKFTLNYKREKITFDNTLEWRLGLQNSSGDTIRDISINDDLLRTYSVFGYKAFNKWSYSTTLELKTQIFNIYPENKNNRKASFLSPLDVNLGIGMSYNLNKKFENNLTRKLKLALNLSPLSMNFRYIRDDKVDETSFKLEKGKKTKTDLGSLVNSELTFNFNSFITWNSRFKYFTNYESITAEFENKLDFILNRYFSTSLFVYLRYDETSKKDDKLKYLQVNEILSFGLNYKW
ncbi:MAG: DUF3078 domain-containing protein [Dysgonomonas sp.]